MSLLQDQNSNNECNENKRSKDQQIKNKLEQEQKEVGQVNLLLFCSNAILTIYIYCRLDLASLQGTPRYQQNKRLEIQSFTLFLIIFKLGKQDSYYYFRNSNYVQNIKRLISLKSIIARQLPKMPKQYIVRIIFDRQHESMIILKKCYSNDGTVTKQVIGGCVYRPFYNKKLSQVVFLAIDSQQQVKGYGTRLMNKLKSYAKTKGVQFFMTYADNMATDYFQKNGFSSTIRLPKSRYRNYIKDYENGTLMECYLDTNIHFDEISKVLLQQRESLLDYLFQLSGFKQNPYQMKTLDASGQDDQRPIKIKFKQIQGVEQAGWEQQEYQRRLNNQKNRPFQEKAKQIIEKLKKQDSMWPFIDAVKKQQAPDYYSVIANPMWLTKIEQRLNSKQYSDIDAFSKDMNQIFDNAMSYNKPNTIFYKYAREMKENLRFSLNQLQSDMNRGDLYNFE